MLPHVFLIALLTILQLKNQIIYSCDPNTSCGCSDKSQLHLKIVGGQTVRTRIWNWVVSIHVRNKLHCAGSILSNSWILTAAHCFSYSNNLGNNILQIDPSYVTIHAGSNNRFEEKQIRNVAKIILHPHFDEFNFNNDIALIQLSSPFDMTDITLGHICLPTLSLYEYPPINSSVVAIGWGRLWQNGPESLTLQQVILKIIDYNKSTCYPLIYDRKNQFCAGVDNSKKDTCQGDSGGPLLIFTSSKQWVIAGLTSFGYGCAHPLYSGVYTRIITYLDWIHLYINNTNNSMYPSSLITDSSFDYNDIEWINNMSFHHSISLVLLIILLTLLY
ncbi:unnamed protein product [Adineta steineri]|uniref:Peptidase S1 domain-containing protein n=1 Tax=Adineta steineri TaxID=433720 RepID=A0A813MD99_9BILA|nr:unnamed protein product [Adineta steineri]CAF3976667.1 unnamed protein product [Adineta steineri]